MFASVPRAMRTVQRAECCRVIPAFFMSFVAFMYNLNLFVEGGTTHGQRVGRVPSLLSSKMDTAKVCKV